MRFRITIFLVIANAALFHSIWYLERSPVESGLPAAQSVAFTELEISGKNIDKPRVLKFENNRWRIVSPIDWNANLFAVNRIRNQIEFLDRETGFFVAEITGRGHSLAEYGLDNPVFTIKYGNGAASNTLKIGNSSPSGDRIYMLDSNGGRVIVADKEFVDGLVVDMERLRSQTVFEIPRFEVSAFSVRIPLGDVSAAPTKANVRRVGLVKDGGKWKFETPISADADPREVDAFLNEICQMSARGFGEESGDNAGFDVSSLPMSIAIEGTNRRQVLLVGNPTKDGKRVYAKLENNPTIFTLDAEFFKGLDDIQDVLRERNVARFDPMQTVGIDISVGGKTLSLRKIKNGAWDVIGKAKNGDTLTASADLSLVASLLNTLEKSRARQFVSDLPPSSENASQYGFDSDALHIVAIHSDQSTRGIKIGAEYKNGAETLRYASVDGEPSVYGVSAELSKAADADFMRFRSRVLEAVPEKAVPVKLLVSAVDSSDPIFEISAENGDFSSALKKLSPRESAAANVLLVNARRFVVDSYIDSHFSKNGAEVSGATEPWVYSMELLYELPGTAASVRESKKWFFTKRLGGALQYGGAEIPDEEFTLTQPFVDALFELTQERKAPQSLIKSAPLAPVKK